MDAFRNVFVVNYDEVSLRDFDLLQGLGWVAWDCFFFNDLIDKVYKKMCQSCQCYPCHEQHKISTKNVYNGIHASIFLHFIVLKIFNISDFCQRYGVNENKCKVCEYRRLSF